MAKQFPGTLLEFEHWFRTEEACLDYLIALRWPEGFRCPKCKHAQAWRTERGLLHCGGCRRDVSVRVGTIFERSKLSLRLWFRAIWWVTNQKSGVSALGLQRTLGLGSYRTAWMCLHKLRRAMLRIGREQLTGKVEIDDFFLGGHKRGSKHRQDGKVAVVCAVEIRGQGMGRIRLQPVPNLSKGTLGPVVAGMVAPGTHITTDGWAGYLDLSKQGHKHDAVWLHNMGYEAPTLVLPRVHRVISLLKRWLLGIHQGRVSQKHVTRYLDEFTFRFNRRLSPSRGKLFFRLIQQAVVAEPAGYQKIIGKP